MSDVEELEDRVDAYEKALSDALARIEDLEVAVEELSAVVVADDPELDRIELPDDEDEEVKP